MPLAPDSPRCHGHTPAFWPRPVEMCRSCQRYAERTTAEKLTPWLHADSLVTTRKSEGGGIWLACAERIDG